MTAIDERPTAAVPATQDPNLDLGFGAVVARESRQRLLNRDGTFNVRREGLRYWESLSAYHHLLTITWPKFLSYVAVSYAATNAIFALFYVAAGAHALTGFGNERMPLRYVEAFFFSVQTLSTIGYGNISPANNAANVLVAVESLVGLLGFSLVAGIVFARFSRPMAQIVFSRYAIIAPYRDITAFMFRLVNQKKNEIVELRATVMMTRRKKDGTSLEREFLPLKLERDRVVFFPLTWTVVHPIDQSSPLWGWREEDLRSCAVEFLVLLNGFDETFSQNVHTRSSYTTDEVVWGAKFKNVFNEPDERGTISIDIRKLHEIERVAL
jgi:inward rectifier potassium channel